MVRLPDRIHIFGASGTGTTSLAVAIATRYGHRHLDTDDFYWMRTDPPYREVRPPEDRLALLRRSIRETHSWVLSGSLCGWGDPLIPAFELVVFVTVPTAVRLARLGAREIERYGRHAIAPGTVGSSCGSRRDPPTRARGCARTASSCGRPAGGS